MKLISSCRIPPCKGAVVQIQAPGIEGTSLLEPRPLKMNSLEVEEALLDFSEEGIAQVVVANPSHLAHMREQSLVLSRVLLLATPYLYLLMERVRLIRRRVRHRLSWPMQLVAHWIYVCQLLRPTHSWAG